MSVSGGAQFVDDPDEGNYVAAAMAATTATAMATASAGIATRRRVRLRGRPALPMPRPRTLGRLVGPLLVVSMVAVAMWLALSPLLPMAKSSARTNIVTSNAAIIALDNNSDWAQAFEPSRATAKRTGATGRSAL